jgi:hypothetical protein
MGGWTTFTIMRRRTSANFRSHVEALRSFYFLEQVHRDAERDEAGDHDPHAAHSLCVLLQIVRMVYRLLEPAAVIDWQAALDKAVVRGSARRRA